MSDRPLAGQRAIVTGASSGIGEAVAVALGEAGADVVLNYLTGPDEAERAAQRIRAAGSRATTVEADLATAEGCRALFEQADVALGGLDVLVANAGVQRDAPFADMTLEEWREVIDLNLTGQFLCAQEAVRRFRRQGLDTTRSRALGKIVFTSSVHQTIPWAEHANYAAAKGGLKLLMQSIAQELAPEKIRVNAIAPGAIKTAINRAAWAEPEAARKLLTLIPFGRIGEPEDVARAAVWLASDAADYVVGATLFVDGGMSLYPAFREGG